MRFGYNLEDAKIFSTSVEAAAVADQIPGSRVLMRHPGGIKRDSFTLFFLG
jgi:hypothetical protein